jgi:glucose/arabinose dehydrogenase
MKTFTIISAVLTVCFFYSCRSQDTRNAKVNPGFRTDTLVSGYQIIWGMDFLPDGDLIFTEKTGKIFRRNNDNITEITGFPEVRNQGQGGLLDIKVHPDYKSNGWIYTSYAATGEGGKGQLKLVRFKINDNRISNLEEIFTTNAVNTWNGHYGSRIEFDKKNHVFLSIGEGGEGTYGGPKRKNNNAQDPSSPWGKVHRLMDDGTVPADNPVIPGNPGPTSVYSYGHRNPQGLAMNPETNELWEAEHGPKGGDELNVILKGANYGWPIYSLGVNYDGTTISSGHKAPGITEPLFAWIPSIGTCGIAFITSDKFKSFKGNLLVSGLASQSLHRCIISGHTVTQAEPLLSKVGRVRDVAQAPDGSIYVSIENPGRIIRIIPE